MRASTLSYYEFILCTLVVGAMVLVGNHLIYALPIPANHTITTKLTDTLKSITSNVSTSIQSDIDKVISDTMDIKINNVMSQLSNATIFGNNDELGINPANMSQPVTNEFASFKVTNIV